MEDRWEYGSEFHLPSFNERTESGIVPSDAIMYATGRHSLMALISHGLQERNWRRCFVPAYFCSDVVSCLENTGIRVVRYMDSPLWPMPVGPTETLQLGDVVLLVNYFGLRGQEAVNAFDFGPADLLEDHTHDPWSDWAKNSTAAYCFASLRKTLPISDGAMLWSPLRYSLPGPVSTDPNCELTSFKKFSAMVLKRHYLQGKCHDKSMIRRLQVEGEREIAKTPISSATPRTIQLITKFPWEDWRTIRVFNYETLSNALAVLDCVNVLTPFSTSACPFSVVLRFEERGVRDFVREELRRRAIYTAIHWPTQSGADPVMQRAARLSERLLSFPCDFRYNAHDFRRVAAAAHNACRKYFSQVAVKEEHGALSVY